MSNPPKMTQDQKDEHAAKMAQLLRRAFDEISTPAYKDRVSLVAAQARTKYLALVQAGFTEQQALDLCHKIAG